MKNDPNNLIWVYVRWSVLSLFSPTRAVIDYLKRGLDDVARKRLIDRWNGFFLIGIIGWISIAYFAHLRPRLTLPVWVILWIFPISRINELWFAFWRDSVDRLQESGAKDSPGFSMVDRLRNLLRSYFEVTLNFGVLYFCLPAGMFSGSFHGIIEALYFSVVTITTLGYTIFPSSGFSQFWCAYELAVGFTLLVITFGFYVAVRSSQR